MADPPVAVSTASAPLSQGGDPFRVSPETLRQIHEDEVRLLRSRMLSAAAATVLAAGAWIFVVATNGSAASPMVFGYVTVVSALRAATAGQRWWTFRQRDPETNAADEARARARSEAESLRLTARPGYATYSIAAALIIVALLEFNAVGSVPRAIAAAGLDKSRVAAGEWWRLLTAAFLHGSVAHLFTNFTALLLFGRIIEADSTRTRLLLVFLTATWTMR